MTTDTLAQTTRIDVPGFRGLLIEPGDPGFDEARAVYNGAIDRSPRLVARCVDVADVMAAVTTAGERGLDPRRPRRWAQRRRARRVGRRAGRGPLRDESRPRRPGRAGRPGRGRRHVGRRRPRHPPVRPGGAERASSPPPGSAGLTLGGGIGYLSRQFGLTIDSLLAADVVLADGTMVTADAERHPDLFWALRGGGGNFGVVTAFTFRAHPVRDVVGGPMFFDVDRAAEVMRAWDRFLDDAPELPRRLVRVRRRAPRPRLPHRAARPHCGRDHLVLQRPSTRTPTGALGADAGRSGRCSTASARCRGPHSSPSSTRCSRPGCSGTGRRTSSTSSPTRRSPSHVEHGEPAADPAVDDAPLPRQWRRTEGRRHRDGVRPPRQARYAQVIVGVDPDPARLDEMTAWARRLPRRSAPALGRRWLREHDDGRRGAGPGARQLRRQLRAGSPTSSAATTRRTPSTSTRTSHPTRSDA